MSEPAVIDTINVHGTTLRKADVLQAEVMPSSGTIRSGFYMLTGMIFPILSMIIFSCLEGPMMWALGCVTAAGPFIAIIAALAIKKPWGVIVETPTRYLTVYRSSSKEQAEKVMSDIRAAIA